MPNDNKEIKNEEIKNLTEEDLDNVTGGSSKAPEFKAGKAQKDNIR